jgi:hypothetical protein
MGFPRIKPDIHSFYHCISRVVEGRFIFAIHHGRSVPAEKLLSIMRPLETFSGVRVLDYVIMANHFHLVCEVPDRRPLSQSEVLERIGTLYGPGRVRALQKQLASFSEQPDGAELRASARLPSICSRPLPSFSKVCGTVVHPAHGGSRSLRHADVESPSPQKLPSHLTSPLAG